MIIITPTNVRMTARPYFNRWNFVTTCASRKNSERSPITAKMFDVNTMKGSRVMPKIAGMESMAKMRSVASTSSSTRSSGVA